MTLRAGGMIFTLVIGILAAPLAADAQQPAKIPRVGILRDVTPSPGPDDPFPEFRQGLRELGYVEGQNIVLEYRSAEGKPERLPALAAELVRFKVDLIVAVFTPAALAAQRATSTVPIVMAPVGDPLGSGLVASLARPGGNITGVTNIFRELSPKRLQLLKEVVPKVSRVGVLVNPTNPLQVTSWTETENAAKSLGVTLQALRVEGPQDLESAFEAARKGRVGALVALAREGGIQQAAVLSARARLPAISPFREFAEAGGLMAYGVNFHDLLRRAATYVDKILKGAKPADLPVEQPTRFVLVINLKTAKALGITFPQSILIRADQLIQ